MLACHLFHGINAERHDNCTAFAQAQNSGSLSLRKLNTEVQIAVAPGIRKQNKTKQHKQTNKTKPQGFKVENRAFLFSPIYLLLCAHSY